MTGPGHVTEQGLSGDYSRTLCTPAQGPCALPREVDFKWWVGRTQERGRQASCDRAWGRSPWRARTAHSTPKAQQECVAPCCPPSAGPVGRPISPGPRRAGEPGECWEAPNSGPQGASLCEGVRLTYGSRACPPGATVPLPCKPRPPLLPATMSSPRVVLLGKATEPSLSLVETLLASRKEGLPRALGQRALRPNGLARKGASTGDAFLWTQCFDLDR